MVEFALWIIVGLVVIGIFENMGDKSESDDEKALRVERERLVMLEELDNSPVGRWIKRFENLKPESGDIEDSFYIYFYMIEGVVKYIGKGTVQCGAIRYERATDINNHKYCKPYLKEITVRIMETFEFEGEALKRESQLIARYGLENLLNEKA